MEGTREDRLARLRAQRDEKESLMQRDSELARELNELENEVPVQ